MSKTIAQTILLLCIITGTALSQNAKVIKLRFPDAFTAADAQALNASFSGIEKGDIFQVEIDNINLNLFEVSIGKRDTTLSMQLSVPTFGSFNADNLASAVSSLTQQGTGASTTPPAKNPGQMMTADIETGLNAIQPTDVGTALARIGDYEGDLKRYASVLDTIKKEIDDNVFAYNHCLIYSFIQPPVPPAKWNGFDVDTLYKIIADQRQHLADLSTHVSRLSKVYQAYFDSLPSKLVTPAVKSADAALKKAFDAFSTTMVAAQQSVSVDSSLNYIKSIASVLNNKETTYYSLPLQFSQEQTKLDITIQPRDLSSGQTYSTELVFPVKQDHFFGVSGGFFVSFLSTYPGGSYSPKQTMQTVNAKTDTGYTIVDENISAVEFGISALVDYGWRTDCSLLPFWQIGFGPAATVMDQQVKPRLMLSTGPAWGDDHYILLNVGAVLGYNDVLSKAYTVGGFYAIQPQNLTVPKLAASVYVSLSYLFYQ